MSVVLPGFDKNGRIVVVQRLNLADPKANKPDDVMRVCSMITDIWLKNSSMQGDVCGVVVISDSVGMTTGHMSNFSPAWAKKVMTIFEDVYPSRPKVMHVVNMPGFFETIYGIFKSFMKKKMQERLVVHPKGDWSKMIEDLGADILPKEYGGTNGTLAIHAGMLQLYTFAFFLLFHSAVFHKLLLAAQAKDVFAHRDFLLKQTKLKSNEKKRQVHIVL